MISRYMEVSVKQRSDTHTVDSKLQSYGHRLRGDSREQRIINEFEHGNMDQEEAAVEETSHKKSSTAAGVRCQPTDACTGDDALPGRSPIKLMCVCTATTTTEHNLQMRPLEAVPDGTCHPMSEGVGPAQQRSGAEGTGKHLFPPHVAFRVIAEGSSRFLLPLYFPSTLLP